MQDEIEIRVLKVRDLVIFGCGGFGREVLQIVLNQNRVVPTWRMLGFLVSPDVQAPDAVQGFPVRRQISQFGRPEDIHFAVGLGSPVARRSVVGNLCSQGVRNFPVLVHPQAWLGAEVSLGEGVIICAGALITTDIVIGPHTHVNIGATVGHDTVIGAFSTLSPGVHISGKVALGEGVEIGSGACVNGGVAIGPNAVIGSAAAVVRDIPAGCTAVGVPAKVIKEPTAS